MLAMRKSNMQGKDSFPERPLRAPTAPVRPKLVRINILHRAPQTAWIKDDSLRANNLLDGLASYLRTRDPVGGTK